MPQTKTFHAALDAITDPECWRLLAHEVDGDDEVELEMCEARELDAKTLRELAPGRWDLELVPVHPTASSKLNAKKELRRVGKLKARFDVDPGMKRGQQHVDLIGPTRARAREASPLDRRREELSLEVEETRAKLEIAKLERELEKLRDGAGPAPGDNGAGGGMPAWAYEIVRRLDRLEDRRTQQPDLESLATSLAAKFEAATGQREERMTPWEMMQLLQSMQSQARPAPAAESSPAPPSSLQALAELVPFIKTMWEMFEAVRGDREPVELSQIGEIKGLLDSFRGIDEQRAAAGIPAGPAGPLQPRPPQQPQQPRLPDVQTEMRRRVQSLVNIVVREMMGGSDPRAVAIQVEQGLGMMPSGFRTLLLGPSNPAQVISGLSAWLPQTAISELQGQLQVTEHWAWLNDFLQELREPEEDEGGDDDDDPFGYGGDDGQDDGLPEPVPSFPGAAAPGLPGEQGDSGGAA